jgi:hypothetical protein
MATSLERLTEDIPMFLERGCDVKGQILHVVGYRYSSARIIQVTMRQCVTEMIIRRRNRAYRPNPSSLHMPWLPKRILLQIGRA